MWDLISLTRNQTLTLKHWKGGVLTTGPREVPQMQFLNNTIFARGTGVEHTNLNGIFLGGCARPLVES